MQLYFSPMSCSMATRIALYDADAAAEFVEVDRRTKRTADGADFRQLNPLGQVPALRTADGDLLTENAAILQYLADRFPAAGLAPTAPLARARLQQWLCFVGTELHKGVFTPVLDAAAPAEAKSYALSRSASRFAVVADHLAGREHLLDAFSVADAYLFTVLCWTVVTPIDLKTWPALVAYAERLKARPSIARALAEERALYLAEQARVRAA